MVQAPSITPPFHCSSLTPLHGTHTVACRSIRPACTTSGGWSITLADGLVYYVPRRVTTDLNLRIERILIIVDGRMEEQKDETLDVSAEAWLEAHGEKHVPKKVSGGWWGGKKAGEIYFEKFWVKNYARLVVKDEDDGRKAVMPGVMCTDMVGTGREEKSWCPPKE
jgi:hypothetical protein